MGGFAGSARRAAGAIVVGVPFLLPGSPALAACSDTVPFFTYGSCSTWKESRLAPAPEPVRKQVAPLFMPTGRVWQRASGSGEQAISTAASYTDPAGKGGKAKFAIRCRDDTTTARFSFAGYEMGNKGAAREIIYRVDDGDEAIIELERATNHEILGIDQGYRAVPFLRGLIGAKKLRISAIAANGKELRAVLNLEGLGDAIANLRRACHW